MYLFYTEPKIGHEFTITSFFISQWNGRSEAVGSTDTAIVVCTVTECSSFLLLRRFHDDKNEHTMSQEISLDIAQVFLDAISHFMKHHQSFSKDLVDTLVRDVYHLESLANGRKDCCFSKVQEWFWDDGLLSIFFQGEEMRIGIVEGFVTLVRGIDEMCSKKILNQDGERQKTHLHPVLCTLFHKQLLSKEKTPPIESDCNLMLTILDFCGVGYIFSDLNTSSVSLFSSVERFCGGYLFIWLIEFMSIENKYHLSDLVGRLLFKIFLSCLKAVPESTLFEKLLFLLVEGEYNLRRLGIGLEVIAGADGGDRFVQCDILDSFAIKAADTVTFLFHSIQPGNSDEASGSDDGDYITDISYFLKACAGLLVNMTTMLIRPIVIRSWVDNASKTDVTSTTFNKRNTLMDILLLLGSSSTSPFDIDMLSRIVITAFRQGGSTWDSEELKHILEMETKLIPKVMKETIVKLRQELEETPEGEEGLDLHAFIWSER